MRFHLVDNVRGQTLPFATEEIIRAQLYTEVLGRSASRVRLRLSGSTMAVAQGPWLMGDNIWTPPKDYPRRMTTTLLGTATYDLARSAFTEFDMVAWGTWRGFTQNNGRRRGPESGPIGFVFTLAAPEPGERVAPAFIDLYNAIWIGGRS